MDSVVLAGFGDLVSRHSDVLIERPVRIVLIIVCALAIRLIAHRFIDRLTRTTVQGSVPALLRPLKERVAASTLIDAAALVSERRRQRAQTIASVLKSAVSVTLLVMGSLSILDVLAVNLAPFIAGTSIVGVALGFGAQNIIKDFLAGMFIMLEDQYGVGDVIDVKEATGTVEVVGLRTTRLRDVHGTVWYVRNGEIVRVGNQSQGYAQVVLDVPIGTGEDPAQAAELIGRTAAGLAGETDWSDVFLTPPEVLGVEGFDRDTTTIRLTARVRPLEQWRAARELRQRIVTALHGPGMAAGPGDSAPGPTSGAVTPDA